MMVVVSNIFLLTTLLSEIVESICIFWFLPILYFGFPNIVMRIYSLYALFVVFLLFLVTPWVIYDTEEIFRDL